MANRILPGIVTCDVIDGGSGRIVGTTKIDASPDVPVSRRVRLFDNQTGRLIREKFSGVDGSYEFDGIATTRRTYTALSHDHTGVYNAAVADYLTPEASPAKTPTGTIIEAINSGAAAGSPPTSLQYWDTLLLHMEDIKSGTSDGDPLWDMVVLAMHMDGADNGTAFTDQKGKAVSPIGNAKTVTATKKFGVSSAAFDGAGDYLSVATSSDFDLAAGDFTIEAWVRSSVAFSTNKAILSKRATATFKWLSLYVDTSAQLHLEATGDGATWGVNIAGGALSANTWHHIAASRAGNVWRLFVDGVQVSTTTNSLTVSSNTDALCIGVSTGAANDPWTGYMDDLRITKGAARYTADFSASLPSAAFKDYGVELTDVKGNTVYAVGNAAPSTEQVKFGAKSLKLDGAGDFVSVADSAGFFFGTGEFTIEGWFRPSAATLAKSAACLVWQRPSGSTGWALYMATGVVSFWLDNANIVTSSVSLSADTWVHIAVCRRGGAIKMYIDGVERATASGTWTFSDFAAPVSIGGGPIPYVVGNFDFDGFIDDLRITKGVGRYTGAFTPPTSAFPDS